MNNISCFTLYDKFKVCKKFDLNIKLLKNVKFIEFCFNIIYCFVGIKICNILLDLRCKYER